MKLNPTRKAEKKVTAPYTVRRVLVKLIAKFNEYPVPEAKDRHSYESCPMCAYVGFDDLKNRKPDGWRVKCIVACTECAVRFGPYMPNGMQPPTGIDCDYDFIPPCFKIKAGDVAFGDISQYDNRPTTIYKWRAFGTALAEHLRKFV